MKKGSCASCGDHGLSWIVWRPDRPLAEGTVRLYLLSEAISKLGAGNRVETARLGRQQGWL